MVAFVPPNEPLSPPAGLLADFQDATPAGGALDHGPDWRPVFNLFDLDVAQSGPAIIAAGKSDVANISPRKDLHLYCVGGRLNGVGTVMQLTSPSQVKIRC